MERVSGYVLRITCYAARLRRVRLATMPLRFIAGFCLLQPNQGGTARRLSSLLRTLLRGMMGVFCFLVDW